jgi:hypothetical protein
VSSFSGSLAEGEDRLWLRLENVEYCELLEEIWFVGLVVFMSAPLIVYKIEYEMSWSDPIQ